MNLELSEAVRNRQEQIHEFAASVLRPNARRCDVEARVPSALEKELWQYARSRSQRAGNDREPNPDAALEGVVGSEEMAWGDAPIMSTMPGPGLAIGAIQSAGTPEQHRRFLSVFASDEPRYGALAATEPKGGSDVAGYRTSATRADDGWVLNGEKMFCTNGARAVIVVVNANIDPDFSREGQRLFVVPKGTPGYEVVQLERHLGYRCAETARVRLVDCRIPFDHILGGEQALQPAAGFRATMATFNRARPGTASVSVGIGRAAYEYVRDWASSNYPKHSRRWPVVQQKLATIERDLDAARVLCWQAAWMYDRGLPNNREASMAKGYAPTVALRACLAALEIMGPEGYCTDHLVEKWCRDVKVRDIVEGTGQIQRLIISRGLLGRHAGTD